MTLTKITAQSSKADEMAFIAAVAAQAPEGTYLSDLFSEQMLGWVNEQIKNDGCCDLYGTLENAWRETSQARSDVAKVQAELSTAKRTEQQAARSFAEAARYNETCIKELQARIQSLELSIENVRNDRSKVQHDFNQLRAEHDEAQNEIRRLKATIFDMLVASGKIEL